MEKEIILENISTEERNKDTTDIATSSSIDIVKKINNEDKKVAFAVESQIEKIAQAIDLITKQINNGGRVIYVGAGTSGAIAAVDASEMPITYNVDPGLFKAIVAGGIDGLMNPLLGDEDSETEAVEKLQAANFATNDVLVCISASGRTPFVISAIKHALKFGNNNIITVATSRDAEMSNFATVSIEAVVGAEAITGSTRMKSGTAQKMILNMLSTGAMIKQGKVIENLMVDMVPANEKLVQRALKIIMDLTKSPKDEAQKYLDEADNNLRIALEKAQTKMGIKVESIKDKTSSFLARWVGKAKDVFSKGVDKAANLADKTLNKVSEVTDKVASKLEPKDKDKK